jgi:5-methylcytosine-specific restriction endonuclease McrA
MAWTEIILRQNFTCYYCNTDIRDIQKLILKRIITLRKRGAFGYSGLHFELDHKNAIKEDNTPQNLVAACYYCNNDKSNTFSAEVFLSYFGPQRKVAFDKLLQDNEIKADAFFTHHLPLNKK